MSVVAWTMSYRRILVGTDLSDESARAARLALRLGDDHTRVRIAHVSPLGEMPARVDAKADVQRSRLYAWCDKVGITTREQVVLYGSSARELVAEAFGMEADLIVVGHTGGGQLAQMLLGSTARNVVRLATCDVLVARGEPALAEKPVFQHILVATDLHEPSARAARRALRLARESGAELGVLHAIDPDVWQTTLRTPAREGFANADGWVESTYGDTLHTFNEANLEGAAKEHVAHGAPARVIAEQARQDGADLVVVGTHGAGRLERLLLGAHAEAIVERAPCSVLVVR